MDGGVLDLCSMSLEECWRYIRGSKEELEGCCMDDERPQEELGRLWKNFGE